MRLPARLALLHGYHQRVTSEDPRNGSRADVRSPAPLLYLRKMCPRHIEWLRATEPDKQLLNVYVAILSIVWYHRLHLSRVTALFYPRASPSSCSLHRIMERAASREQLPASITATS